MANVKDVVITGWLQYNISEGKAGDKLAMKIGYLSAYSSGLKFQWTRKTKNIPNEHNGITVYCEFEVNGTEAVSDSWIKDFGDTVLAAGGCLTKCQVIENLDMEWYNPCRAIMNPSWVTNHPIFK